MNDGLKARDVIDRHIQKNSRVRKSEKRLTADDLTLIDKFKLTWRCYIPTATAVLIGGACIVGAHKTHLKRQAALASLLGASQEAFREYRNQVARKLGDRKAQQVEDEMNEELIRENPPIQSRIVQTGHGATLFRDMITGVYFFSDIEKVKRAFHNAQVKLERKGHVCLNEVLTGFGLEPVELGDIVAWGRDEAIQWRFSACTDEEYATCLVIQYENLPRSVFGDRHNPGFKPRRKKAA